MDDLNNIFKEIKNSITAKEKKLIKKAYNFSKKSHEGQFRGSGSPYFQHVFETGKNLAIFGLDPITISAGLLHDVVEDTDITEEDFEKEFGKEISFLINGVTKLGKLKYRGKERYIESLRKFFIASAKDFRVIAIKLADRLHNVKTLEFLREDKAKRIALETIEIYAPLAYRLGMGKLVGELQDASFPYAYKKEYEMVTDLLKKRKQVDEKYINKVWKNLKKEMALQKINDNKTHHRIKKKYSLWKKLIKKEMDINKIYDIVALRVIVPKIEDCYKVLGLIHTMWRPLPGRIKDYIALPKTNGYQSIHTTIFTGDGGITEIQIRTPEMHQYAEYGFASHFLYKKEKTKKENLKWLDELKELDQKEISQTDFLKNLSSDFFEDRIFVFTPEGDILDLPKDASPIDFAYAIHTHIGNHIKGAKINNKFVAIKTPLKNGDIVEIEHSENSHPSNKWIDWTKTSLAKRQIKNYFKKNGGENLWERMRMIGK